MGFRWTISLVFLHFLACYSILFFSLIFIFDTSSIVHILDILLSIMFLFISSHFPSSDFICSWGPRSFGPWGWFLIHLRDDGDELNIGTLLVSWFRRWRYIACSCQKAPCCTRVHVMISNKNKNTHTHTRASAFRARLWLGSPIYAI